MHYKQRDHIGFIAILEEGTIKNLKFENSDVYSEKELTAIVVANAFSGSKIENIEVINGKVETISGKVGVICGYLEKYKGENGSIIRNCINNATIISCYNIGEINNNGSAGTNIGGIVGTSNNITTIEYCYNLGNILNNTTGTKVGGIVGNCNTENKYNVIQNCYNKGNITSYGIMLGGIIGYNSQYVRILNCHISNSTQVKYKTTLIANEWGNSNNNYLGKLIGSAYTNEEFYINNVTDIKDENMPTVYEVMNKFNNEKSDNWSDNNLNQPNLLWQK